MVSTHNGFYKKATAEGAPPNVIAECKLWQPFCSSRISVPVSMYGAEEGARGRHAEARALLPLSVSHTTYLPPHVRDHSAVIKTEKLKD